MNRPSSILAHVAAPLAVASAFAACATTSDSSVVSTTQDLTIDATATYSLVGVQSGKCVTVAGDSTVAGAKLTLVTCTGSGGQRFTFKPAASGSYTIVNAGSGQCVDVPGASTTAGTQVAQWSCNNGSNQAWVVNDVGGGAANIVGVNAKMVLNVSGGSSADGTPIIQSPASSAASEQFKLVSTNTGTTVCGTANENANVTLSCPSGTVISAIPFASYGTPTGTCGSFAASACNAANSISVVQAACVGKSNCTVGANNTTFGDPCPGTVKHLDVQTTCAAGGTSGSGGTYLAYPVSPGIVVDQFGYRTGDEKIAVFRKPVTGFDAGASYVPSAHLAVIDASTGTIVFSGAAQAWNGGGTDTISGDQVWWLTFSSVATPGSYIVVDLDAHVRSYPFSIADNVYAPVLKAAVRMFFYQRAGFAKTAAYAGANWADGASHLGPLQDKNCRRYNAPNDATTERDLSGGWFDAGDFNKYTNWLSGYVRGLMRAYSENPAAFTDDFGIPESGNGIPDVIDEAKWGIDWLRKMQNADGSVLSIQGLAGASPPSAATGQSLYGNASTSATLSAAGAFAHASRILRTLNQPALNTYADDLLARAKTAWSWAAANPSVVFRNNDAASGTSGLGAGQQETDDAGRANLKFAAASALFLATGDATYRAYLDANYSGKISPYWVGPWAGDVYDAALEYASAPGATPASASAILSAYKSAVESGPLASVTSNADAYRSAMGAGDYVWGSNAVKARDGLLLANIVSYGIDSTVSATSLRGAEGFAHYLHGVNPLSIVYLTNMSSYGAENSATTLFDTWFSPGTPWSVVAPGEPGPAPGYLTGGPYPGYAVDGCCPSSCGSAANNALCTSESLTPPKGQPAAKSYKNFNTGWPVDSWQVTEPSDGYQVAYIRLISKFVK